MRAIVALLVVLSATSTAFSQYSGGVSQTMIDPGISDGGNGQQPCYYGEQEVVYNGARQFTRRSGPIHIPSTTRVSPYKVISRGCLAR